jgi:hypothetical protein
MLCLYQGETCGKSKATTAGDQRQKQVKDNGRPTAKVPPACGGRALQLNLINLNSNFLGSVCSLQEAAEEVGGDTGCDYCGADY